MTAIGDALLAATDAYRINYEILGNSEPALHVHVFPRRMTEPDQYRGGPVFNYPEAERESRPFDRREMIGCSDRFGSSWKRVGMLCREMTYGKVCTFRRRMRAASVRMTISAKNGVS